MTTRSSTAATYPDPEPPAWFTSHCAVVADVGVTVHDGCPVRWLRWGDPAAAPLVLVHGGGAHARWWVPFAPFFSSQWCVIAPDLSGMGDSGWRPDGYRTELWADEVLAVVADACPDAARRPVLVGHSLGGSVVAVAGVRQPDRVRGVVLCDIGVRRHDDTDRARRAGRHFQNRLTYASEAEAVARFKLIPRQDCANEWMVAHIARHSVRAVGPAGVNDPTRADPGEETGWAWKFDWRLFARSYDRPFADYLEELGRQTFPVACLFGERSRIVTEAVAARLAAHLGERPTVWIPDARHHLMADQPIAFVAALRSILTGM